MFALNLNPDTGRILSATLEEFATSGMPLVERLPNGDISDFLYSNGEYVYDPLPPVINYPKVSEDVEVGKIFSVNDYFYRATMPIPRGESVTRYNSEPVSITDIINALQEAQKGT